MTKYLVLLAAMVAGSNAVGAEISWLRNKLLGRHRSEVVKLKLPNRDEIRFDYLKNINSVMLDEMRDRVRRELRLDPAHPVTLYLLSDDRACRYINMSVSDLLSCGGRNPMNLTFVVSTPSSNSPTDKPSWATKERERLIRHAEERGQFLTDEGVADEVRAFYDEKTKKFAAAKASMHGLDPQ